MNGLQHPADLAAWKEWQSRVRYVQRGLNRARRTPEPTEAVLNLPSDAEPTLVVAADITNGPKLQTLLKPARLVGLHQVAVLSPRSVAAELGPDRHEVSLSRAATWEELTQTVPCIRSLQAGLSYGHYLGMGALLDRWALDSILEHFVLQHGLLTPFQPPLPEQARLLAWSAADAEFWASGRDDVTAAVVGSQLLADAAASPAATAGRDRPPTYLGQLHGAELPRRGMARAAFTFCRDNNATYRPHPSEIDKLSRAQHALWERRGLTIDRSGAPLREHDGPVVAAFSTGVLEAAARGVPSFVHYPEAPMWLAEFWDRYGMKQWGEDPTPAPWTGADPAAAIRAAVMDVIGRNNG